MLPTFRVKGDLSYLANKGLTRVRLASASLARKPILTERAYCDAAQWRALSMQGGGAEEVRTASDW